MIYIGILLHAYQPPTQSVNMLKRIYNESYEPLIGLLEREKNVFFSMDLSKSLGERLEIDFLKRIRNLYQDGRIELLNTCAYHYLMPITPLVLVERQLKINERFYRETFIDDSPLPGVFPPELAYSPEVAQLLKNIGYFWCLADDEPFVSFRASCPAEQRVPFNWIPAPVQRFGVIMRSSLRSKEVAFQPELQGKDFANHLIDSMKDWQNRLGLNKDVDGYLILAMDAETFGHHMPWCIERLLLPFCNWIKERGDAQIVPINEIFERFEHQSCFVPKGSWSTGDSCYPYPLWDDPGNSFHRAWNEFIQIANAVFLKLQKR